LCDQTLSLVSARPAGASLTSTYASWLNLVEVFFGLSSGKRCVEVTSPASTT
jgi:hypothetical protein